MVAHALALAPSLPRSRSLALALAPSLALARVIAPKLALALALAHALAHAHAIIFDSDDNLRNFRGEKKSTPQGVRGKR